MTNVSCFFSEFLATSVLLILVLSIGDKQNHPVPHGLAPVALFLLILGIGCALGMETGKIHSHHHLRVKNKHRCYYRLRYQSSSRSRSTAPNVDGRLWQGRVHFSKVRKAPHIHLKKKNLINKIVQPILDLVSCSCPRTRCTGWSFLL